MPCSDTKNLTFIRKSSSIQGSNRSRFFKIKLREVDMTRWSFRKRFGRISYADFLKMAQQFITTMGQHHSGSNLKVSITLYASIPHSVSAPMDGIAEFVEKENAKLELAKIAGMGSVVPYVPQELFASAKNVQLVVHAPGYDYAFGHIECKGLLPHHIVFYVQSGNADAVEKIKDVCVGKHRPSKLLFRQGSGFERCHRISLS